MDFDFSDEQLQLRDAVQRWAERGYPFERRRAIAAAIERAQKSGKPSLIACKTVIGYGAPKKAGTSKAHGEPLGVDT